MGRLPRLALLFISAGALLIAGAAQASVTSQPSQAAAPSRPVAVTATAFQTCVLLADHTVQCWGGNPTVTQWPAVQPGTYTAVTLDGDFGCGITLTQSVSCWDTPPDLLKGQPPSGTFVAISANTDHVCMIATDATLSCWGQVPAQIPGSFSALSAGDGGVCAVATSGALDCFVLAGETGGESLSPTPSGTFTSVSVGTGWACALRTDGTIACFGDAAFTPPTGQFTAVSVRHLHACALTPAGSIDCWGDNSAGELSNIPTGKFTSISAGEFDTCGVASDSTVHCWGSDSADQLGAPPVLNRQKVPGGLQDFIYFFNFASQNALTTDGIPVAAFSVSKGSLPPGLTLDPSYGLFQGYPKTPGSFPFTVTVSNVEGTVSEATRVIVLGWLLGFKSPANHAHIAKSGHTLLVSFKLGDTNGNSVAAKYASGLTMKVSLSRKRGVVNGVTSAPCTFGAAKRLFQCKLKLPASLLTGTKHPYYLTVFQQGSSGYEPSMPVKPHGPVVNPEVIYFR